MDAITGPKRRSRSGCWTCRKRKKKCDATGFPCQACVRLKLECEHEVRLVWEDDARRHGMRRRGPPVATERRKDSAVYGSQTTYVPDDFTAQTTCFSIAEAYGDPSSSNKEYSGEPERFHSLDFVHHANILGDGRMSSSILGSRPLSPDQQLTFQKSISQFPRPLGPTESIFLEHYILRFSRTYPTSSGPSNPFLSIFLPLAMQSDVVFHSLLALSGATRWNDGQAELESDALRFRQRALKGCRTLLEDIERSSDLGAARSSDLNPGQDKAILKTAHAAGDQRLLHLLTSSVLFLLYEKVTGDTAWLPHFTFMNALFERYLQPLLSENSCSSDIVETVRFLHQLFLYNDLVRSTSTHTAPLSSFYLSGSVGLPGLMEGLEGASEANDASRYFFPNLISRMGAGDMTVSNADIAAWNGVMDWLPSFALDKDKNNSRSSRGDSEQAILSDLYRTTARIYRLRVFAERGFSSEPTNPTAALGDMPQLASWAMSLIALVSEDSTYETALLWPIGIAARELDQSQQIERNNIINRLQSMERRFQMRHFRRAQDFLKSQWHCQDSGIPSTELGQFPASGTMLLG